MASDEINEINQEEANCLSVIFKDQVSVNSPLEPVYIDWIYSDSLARILATEDNNRAQYFIYIDRNENKQNIMVGFFNPPQDIIIIGWDKVSTGNHKRKGHFITPTGVFKNSIDNMGYRALGTKNSKGWRGLGKKNSRIWDFGWQKTPPKNGDREIRLLLHATDPDFGEKRLGQVDSKGCVRISAKLNYFLDHYGLLDYEYEQSVLNGSTTWLLLKNRETVKTPGQFMIVGDSSEIIIVKDQLP